MHRNEVARWSGVASLLVVAALHATWARGSAWPAGQEQALAQAVIGRDTMPSARACLYVAALLTAAAALVAGWPRRWPRLRQYGVAGVVTVLTARGIIGAAGLMPQEHASSTFTRWNRRLFSPVCLALAGLCAAAMTPPRTRS